VKNKFPRLRNSVSCSLA